MALDSTVSDLAQQLWNYLRLNLPVEKADCIVGLGSYDLRVADRCAELYAGGWAPLVIFSGHLGNWTKRMWDSSETEIFAEHAIARGVPRDKIWLGVYQTPGAFEAMQRGACTKLMGVHLVKGAGHSVAEEQPEEVNRVLLEFLQRANAAI